MNIFDRIPKPVYFPILLTIIVMILSLFNLQGSSVGMYNKYFYGASYKDSNVIMGQPRAIRSDEWIVQTTLLQSQAELDFPLINNISGLKENISSISDVPAKNWKVLFHPSSWIYFIFPAENAFAFKWWIRAALMLISIYSVFYLLSKKISFSVIGSLLFFFTPFVQWWYSTYAIECITYGSFIIYFFIKFYTASSLLQRLKSYIFLTYFSICFAFTMYPPFQISVFYFCLFFLLGYVIQNGSFLRNKNNIISYVLMGISYIGIVGLSLYLYYMDNKDVIDILRHTVYPGSRDVAGGGYDMFQFISGFYNIQLLSDSKKLPPILGNQCEASTFFMLFPYLFPVTIFITVKQFIQNKKVDFILIFIMMYLFLCTLWLFTGLPHILARITFLNQVTQNRLIIGVGMANLFFLLYYLLFVKIPQNIDFKIAAFISALYAFFINLYVGFYFQSQSSLFIKNNGKIILISLIVAVLVWLLILKKRNLFLGLFLFFSIASTLGINPLYHSLGPLLHSTLSEKVQAIHKSDPSARWAVYDNIILGNFLRANGVRSLSGVYLYPQLDLWKNFDVTEKYINIYNRYAHVYFVYNNKEPSLFKKLGEDIFVVNIDPCNKDFAKLNVKYYVFLTKVESACLKQKANIPYSSMPVFIYERI
ncbi:hypothetical protein HGA88_01320 [Candidatus Roizmanbacteria bacterium]|nr:hypothetical protein [Candidatus Roizmanbacteria bacterium]